MKGLLAAWVWVWLAFIVGFFTGLFIAAKKNQNLEQEINRLDNMLTTEVLENASLKSDLMTEDETRDFKTKTKEWAKKFEGCK